MEEYPNCTVIEPAFLGNGRCNFDGRRAPEFNGYNTEECNYDFGDCVFYNQFPNCTWWFVFQLDQIGDGNCDEKLNTEECGWDGFDCRQP